LVLDVRTGSFEQQELCQIDVLGLAAAHVQSSLPVLVLSVNVNASAGETL